jgi:hypothetical protein
MLQKNLIPLVKNNTFLNTIKNISAKPPVLLMSRELSLIINVSDNGPLQ